MAKIIIPTNTTNIPMRKFFASINSHLITVIKIMRYKVTENQSETIHEPDGS